MTNQRPLKFSESQPESPPNSAALVPTDEFFPTNPPTSNTNNNAFTEFSFDREGSPEEFYNPSEDAEPVNLRSRNFIVRTDKTQFPYDPNDGDSYSQSSHTAADQLVQEALVEGGLASLAKDPGFVSVTKKEMADAMRTSVDDMESVAQGFLSEQASSVTSVKKRRPIPVPAPAVAAQEMDQLDPAVRRKRRPIPLIPSVQEADSNV